ncbi:hypothetical protein [Mycolicibacterium hodleri]|uniref:Glyoxalase n=1 Tax=Mycolicibacterium hodleri TaxID=49897 RepID=A0A502E2F0_9MYCO|nr:hypothetical protein [Mycolicibacterium hodleri]TPG31717.1 hypothetical protein EAH80_22565 [Mycolicibacterium hodleri]
MTVLDSPIPRFHLAVPVDDLDVARHFYGTVLGLPQGRSAESWADWNLHGHQFGTHLAPGRSSRVHNPVDGQTMFLLDPAGNALEFKAFANDSQVFATGGNG